MAQAVLVTGASSGIGRACALRLAASGFRVFAGVRRDQDGGSLRADSASKVSPIRLDVADEASIDAALATVRSELNGAGLLGVVNNAGIAVSGPIEFVPLEDWRRQFEVNVVGLVAVIQRFLPLLRESRGRIVNMSSVGGRFSQPFVAPYVASKHAVEAISDALRIELRPWRIHVVLIEPGSVATPIWSKGLDEARAKVAEAPPQLMQLYGGVIRRMTEIARREGERGVPPERVADAVFKALTARSPRTRYVVGADARAMVTVRRVLPDRWRDQIIVRYAGIEKER
jgi:NAD(P)-dependent dehydrogenase (short-subunit alcohol dehydrogenase family)